MLKSEKSQLLFLRIHTLFSFWLCNCTGTSFTLSFDLYIPSPSSHTRLQCYEVKDHRIETCHHQTTNLFYLSIMLEGQFGPNEPIDINRHSRPKIINIILQKPSMTLTVQHLLSFSQSVWWHIFPVTRLTHNSKCPRLTYGFRCPIISLYLTIVHRKGVEYESHSIVLDIDIFILGLQ